MGQLWGKFRGIPVVAQGILALIAIVFLVSALSATGGEEKASLAQHPASASSTGSSAGSSNQASEAAQRKAKALAKKRAAAAKRKARAAKRRRAHEKAIARRQARIDLAEERKALADTQDSGSQGSDCDPNYEGACLDPNSSDYDCQGGSGDGPDYTDPCKSSAAIHMTSTWAETALPANDW